MQFVEYVDENGFRKQSLITNDMLPSQAHMGIPKNPPDLSRLNCEELLKELNDLLIDRGLYTMKDISGNNLLRSSVEAVFYRKIYQLYKENHPTGLKNGNAPNKKG